MGKKRKTGRYVSKKPRLTAVLWRIAIILLIIDVSAMGMIYWNRHKSRSDFQQMAAAVQEARLPEQTGKGSKPATAVSVDFAENLNDAVYATERTEIDPELQGILEPYRQFYKQNKDLVGWLSIDGTVVNYPVMHTPKEPEKYLHMNFDGEYSYAGVPFMDYRCSEDSDNLLIYGHNMSDETMFHTVIDYRYKSYWQEHPVIRFDSLYEEREYVVFAAFDDRIYYDDETNFKFYDFIDAKNKADYQKAVKKFKDKSLYDTGLTPEYGQQLIMLVTCTYRDENGRFVLVAYENTKS